MKILVTGTAGFIGHSLAQKFLVRDDEVIVANRMEKILEVVKDKVYTRYIFNSDD